VGRDPSMDLGPVCVRRQTANCGHSALTAGCRKAAVRDRASRYGHSSTRWISGMQLARAHPWFLARHCVNCTHR
jgi:hypothetical protein